MNLHLKHSSAHISRNKSLCWAALMLSCSLRLSSGCLLDPCGPMWADVGHVCRVVIHQAEFSANTHGRETEWFNDYRNIWRTFFSSAVKNFLRAATQKQVLLMVLLSFYFVSIWQTYSLCAHVCSQMTRIQDRVFWFPPCSCCSSGELLISGGAVAVTDCCSWEPGVQEETRYLFIILRAA